MAASKVLEYLTFGHLLDAQQANRFLRTSLDGLEDEVVAQSAILPDVLRESVEESVNRSGAKRIVIPLSGGLDSRAILAACLQFANTKDIQCVSIGSPHTTDVSIAKQTCARTNVPWELIDINFDVHYDLDLLSAKARKIHRSKGAWTGAFSLAPRLVIDDWFGSSSDVVITGWTGRPAGNGVTGLEAKPGNVEPATVETSARRFVNSHLKEFFPYPDSIRREWNEIVQPLWPVNAQKYPIAVNISPDEVLRLGFTAGLRGRAKVGDVYVRSAVPYLSRKWLSFWYSRPIRDRAYRHLFIRKLTAAFPNVFWDYRRITLSNNSRDRCNVVLPHRAISHVLFRSLFSKYIKQQKRSLWVDTPGAPLVADFVSDALTSLRRRDNPIVHQFIANEPQGSAGAREHYRWLSTAISCEMHLRAGTI